MKKWFVFAMIACFAVAAQAGEKGEKKGAGKAGGDVTKEQFLKQQEKMAEKKGEEFDQAKAEAKFDKMDKNKDGILSADEKGGKKKPEKSEEE